VTLLFLKIIFSSQGTIQPLDKFNQSAATKVGIFVLLESQLPTKVVAVEPVLDAQLDVL
jgi:hypothetical protein